MKVVFIGVNYKTEEKTISWIKSIHDKNPFASIIVVDNSKADNPNLTKQIDELNIHNVQYIDPGSNLGYFNGAAAGYHQLAEDSDWVVVSNVDIELDSFDMDVYLEKYKDVGVIAPSIISIESGFDKNPYRLYRPSRKMVLIKKIAFSNAMFAVLYSFLSRIRSRIIINQHIDVAKCDEGTSIYLPYGACFIFSKNYFDKGCQIDFPLFLYGEELYVAEQSRRAGIDIIYVPSIRFMNHEHASTSSLMKHTVRKYNYEAMKYILEEFY